MIYDDDSDPLTKSDRTNAAPQHADAPAERERAEAIEGIRAGLQSLAEEKGRPAGEFFADLRERLGLTTAKQG